MTFCICNNLIKLIKCACVPSIHLMSKHTSIYRRFSKFSSLHVAVFTAAIAPCIIIIRNPVIYISNKL